MKKIIEEPGSKEVHHYDNFQIIAGQGTAAKEMIEDYSALDLVLCPVGGGGLLAGTSLSVKALLPTAIVIDCESAGTNDAFRSENEILILFSQRLMMW